MEKNFIVIASVTLFCLVSCLKASLAQELEEAFSVTTVKYSTIVSSANSQGYGYVRAIADINKDNFPDIVAAQDRDTAISLGKAGGGIAWYEYIEETKSWTKHIITNETPTNTFNWRADDIGVGDVDKDGDIDIIGVKNDSGDVYWLKNPRLPGDSPGTCPAGIWNAYYIGTNKIGTETEAYVKELEVADMNKDTKLDVVTRTKNRTSIFLQGSTPTSWTKYKTFTLDPYGSTYNGDGMDVGDLDGDTDVDIALNGFWIENGPWIPHNIDSKWYNGQGTQWYDHNSKVQVADINKDNKQDVLISQAEKPGYPVSWYSASDPKGSWTEHKIVERVDYCHTLQVADFDLDGDLDVLAGEMYNRGGTLPEPPQPVIIYKNGGGLLPSWTAQEIFSAGTYSAAVGDIGNDGDIDIVGVQNWDNILIQFWDISVPPFIVTQPKNQTAVVGLKATFSLVAKGTLPLSYQWQKNNTNISGATSASYTAPAVTLTDSGSTFRCIVKNSAGSITSNSATLTVTANNQPTVGTIAPSSGSSTAGTAVNFSTAYSDTNGWQNIQYVYFLISTAATNGANCFYGYYDQNTNKLYLRNDANTAWLGGYVPGSANIIENSYAKLDCANTIVTGSGNTLSVTWRVTFKSTFLGAKNMYLYVKDDSGAYNGWLQKGTWTVR